MVRMRDLRADEVRHLLAKNDPPLGPTPWVAPAASLASRQIALITTAGIHPRNQPGFALSDASYRVLPGELDAADLVMSHSSVNFDRTGFQEDVNVVFPIDRFRELEAAGSIGALASEHMSFMGAGLAPRAYAASVTALAGVLKAAGTDTVFLTPV